MTTTIDTNPASGLAFIDQTNADTITVSDGPAENGFQTTQIAGSVNTVIFANKSAVLIDGGNKGDSVVFNNPHPAAGLQLLFVQNLGGTGTINGSNPNAGSPDVVAATLNLNAGGGIGTNRALRTQASKLSAMAGIGGAGNINIANGGAAPVTLNTAGLFAINAAGGAITLSNNGAINVGAGGIDATGAINITTNGATADLNTAGGIIQTNTGSVILTIGRDINLGDGSANGAVVAATGITGSAGGNITLNANGYFINLSSGNISLLAGGNITMLTSPGSISGAPVFENAAVGGQINLTAGAGHTLTLDSTGGGSAVLSNNGAITLAADAMVINRPVVAGTASVTLAPASSGQAISLGSTNAPGVLGLTQAELNQVTAGVLRIGSNTTGNITIASPIGTLPGSNTLALINNGSISQKPFGSLIAINLRVSSTGPVTLDNANNNIQVIAANVTNAVSIVDGTHTLTVGQVDGNTGVNTNNSAINLTADAMLFQQSVSAGPGGIVTLAPFTATQQIALGAGNAAGTLGLTDPELGEVSALILRVDAISGNITVSGAVARHPGNFNTLSLATGGSISQTATLSVANLALYTVNGFTLTNGGNAVDVLAFANVNGAVSFTNAAANALIIAAVDGIGLSWNIGTATTISTGGNLTFATGLYATGPVTLISTAGAILDGDNGADVDVTAQILALLALTGIGSAAAPLQTQVSALNAPTSTGGIFINNGAAAPVTLNIGNGGGGVRVTGASGDIVLTNNGTIDILQTNDVIRGPGNITVKALGADADINTGFHIALLPVQGSGVVDVEAGRDMNLGDSNGIGNVESDGGSITLKAGRNITLINNTFVDVSMGGNGGITATAGGNITMNATALDQIFTPGGPITLTTGPGGTLTIASTATTAVASGGGAITFTADVMNIAKGVYAAAGNVLLQPVTAGQLISVGTFAGGLTLSNAALNLVTAKTLTIGNATAGAVTVGGLVAPALATNLTINTGGNFLALAGSTINIGTGTLTIDFGQTGAGATANLTGATVTAGAFNLDFGGANDTLIVGPGGLFANERLLGFAPSDTIDLANLAFDSSGSATLTTGNLLQVTESGQTYNLQLDPNQNFVGKRFLISSDGLTGSNITLSATPYTGPYLVLRNSGTNGLEYFDIQSNQNSQITAAGPMGAIGSDFQALGFGNFSGTAGESDMLMRSTSTGNIQYFDIQNNQIVASAAMGNISTDLQVLGFGDFSGNPGESDMLMRSASTGAVEYFDIQHNQFVAGGMLGSIGSDWQLLGFGNFSGNANETDMLMRSTSTMALEYYDIQNNQIVAAGSMGAIGLDLQVLGIGDFSGNPGESDMLMRSASTGALEWYDIQHNQIVSSSAMGAIGSDWQLLGFGDFSGNPNETDMLMRSASTGAVEWYDIQNNQITGAGSLGSIAAAYQLLGLSIAPPV